ncbi:hypothetical protein [Rhizobium skierniewicense]
MKDGTTTVTSGSARLASGMF